MSPISPHQRTVLIAHKDEDSLTSRVIAANTRIALTTVRNQVRSLVMKNYLEIIPKDQTTDKTRQFTRITELGRKALTHDFSKEPKVAKYGPKKSFFSDTERQAPKYTPYVPDTMVPMRPGANDHLKYKSRGM